ncbi:aminoacyl-tRNA hydrolase [Corynebacterium sp. sy017]|uniref:aminoacyl-tRNA hydrolase n=1 Tax=unclassified Corynebacterium TaxID=2624378 RepID=UPI001186163A|nr:MULTISPECIES: aminoacyl-tRNA hydrolase [unclassified Corynebacterium]MBP3088883.1 aminoacyl-tRNA hydrolase [Corynebacterium sp. sy017]TSD91219.1 aminoacyl-tRNA hydrolase [Corynebacterium sp. SY003]
MNAPASSSPFLILGLGNPGEKYARTRHNTGIMLLEELLERTTPTAQLSLHKRSNTLIAQTSLSGQRVILAKTRSAMNLSGTPLHNLAAFFSIPPEHIIVLFDDLELDFAQHRIRLGGGDHGHNGLRSISKALSTKDYVRVGLGIGRPPGRMEVSRFVLQNFSKQETAQLPILCADAADSVESYLRNT